MTKLSTREKVLITLLLASLYSLFFNTPQCVPEKPAVVATIPDNTDLPYLKKLYSDYNTQYFHDRLTKTLDINLEESNPKYMASTLCNSEGENCTISFNMKYTLATRVSSQALLHEMCHVKTWMKEISSAGARVDHGKVWRSCMLQLDMQGAFREILIDGYKEQERP